MRVTHEADILGRRVLDHTVQVRNSNCYNVTEQVVCNTLDISLLLYFTEHACEPTIRVSLLRAYTLF